MSYATLSTIGWPGGICLLVIPTLFGRAKFLTLLLKGQLLSMLGRSVFVAGMLHPMIITFFFTTDGQALYIQHYQMMSFSLGSGFLSFCMGSAISLLFET